MIGSETNGYLAEVALSTTSRRYLEASNVFLRIVELYPKPWAKATATIALVLPGVILVLLYIWSSESYYCHTTSTFIERRIDISDNLATCLIGIYAASIACVQLNSAARLSLHYVLQFIELLPHLFEESIERSG